MATTNHGNTHPSPLPAARTTGDAASAAALKALMDVLPNGFGRVDAILREVAPSMMNAQRSSPSHANNRHRGPAAPSRPAAVDGSDGGGDVDSPVSVATAAAAATSAAYHGHRQRVQNGPAAAAGRRTHLPPVRSGQQQQQPVTVPSSSSVVTHRRTTRYHSAVTASGGGSAHASNRFRRQATGPPPRTVEHGPVDGPHPAGAPPPLPQHNGERQPFVLRLCPMVARPATAGSHLSAAGNSDATSSGATPALSSSTAATLHQRPLSSLQSPASRGETTANQPSHRDERPLSSAKVLMLDRRLSIASPAPAVPSSATAVPTSSLTLARGGSIDVAQRLFSVGTSTRGGGGDAASLSSRMHIPPTSNTTTESMARWLATHTAASSRSNSYDHVHRNPAAGSGHVGHHLATMFTASWLSKTHKKGYLSAILSNGSSATASAAAARAGGSAGGQGDEPRDCLRPVVGDAEDPQRDHGSLGSTQHSATPAAHSIATMDFATDNSSTTAILPQVAPLAATTSSSCASLLQRIQEALHHDHAHRASTTAAAPPHHQGSAFSRSTSAGGIASSSVTGFVSSKHHYAQDSIFERLASVGTEAHPLPPPQSLSSNQAVVGGHPQRNGHQHHRAHDNSMAHVAFSRSLSTQSTSLSTVGRPRLPPSSSVAASVIAEPAGARWVGGLRSGVHSDAGHAKGQRQQRIPGSRSAVTVPCAPPGSIWGRLYGIAERRMKAREDQERLLLHGGGGGIQQQQQQQAAIAATTSSNSNKHSVAKHQNPSAAAHPPHLLSPASCTSAGGVGVGGAHHHHHAHAAKVRMHPGGGAGGNNHHAAVPAVVHRLYERDVRQKEEARIKKVQELELAEQKRLQAERDAIFKRAAKFRDQQQFQHRLPPHGGAPSTVLTTGLDGRPGHNATATATATAPVPVAAADMLHPHAHNPSTAPTPPVVPTYSSVPLNVSPMVGGLSPMRSNRRSSSASSPQRPVVLTKASWSVGADELIPDDAEAPAAMPTHNHHQQNQPQRHSSGHRSNQQPHHFFTVPASDKVNYRIGDDVSYGGLLNSDTDDASDINQHSFVLTPRGTWQRRSTADATASAAAAAAARSYKTAPLPQTMGGSGSSTAAGVGDGSSRAVMNSSGSGAAVLSAVGGGGPGSRKSSRGPQHIRTSSYVSAVSSPQPKDLTAGSGFTFPAAVALDDPAADAQREEVLDRRVVRSTSPSSYALPSAMVAAPAAHVEHHHRPAQMSDDIAASQQQQQQQQPRPEVARLDFSRLRRLNKY